MVLRRRTRRSGSCWQCRNCMLNQLTSFTRGLFTLPERPCTTTSQQIQSTGWPRPVQMAVALHYFDPAFRSNDDDQSKGIHRAEIESFCSQMFEHPVFDSIACSTVYCGVLFDKAGYNCFALLRPAKRFRFLDHWALLGYKRPPKPELLYSEVRCK